MFIALALSKGIFLFNAILGEASYLFMSHLGLLFVGNSDVWSIVHIVTGPRAPGGGGGRPRAALERAGHFM